MSSKRLELTWVGKETRPKLEPRILLPDDSKSHAAPLVPGTLWDEAYRRLKETGEWDGEGPGPAYDNTLVFGDNLLALRALENEYSGRVQFAYLDPPYNIDASSPHYDDSLEHSIWLTMLKDRLELVRRLLRNDGVVCVQIDDYEGDYLKVLLDEIFGRANYLATFYVQVRYPEKTLKQDMVFHKVIERVHAYGKTNTPKIIPEVEEKSLDKFCWYITTKAPMAELEIGGKRVQVFAPGTYKIEKKEASLKGLKEIWATGTILDGNSSGRFFRDFLDGRASIDGLGALYKVDGIGDDGMGFRFFTGPKKATATKGKYFQGVPSTYAENSDSEKPIGNFYDFAGAFGNCRLEGGADFRSGKKPESWVGFLMERFSEPGDIVLDSFGGSGTTGAVAHKLGRRWILAELGEHCHTHIVPRLNKVIDGIDTTGITLQTGWSGGGGFRYWSLATSMLKEDQFGNQVINPEYNPEMLAEAMCKHLGFTYAPSREHYWMHGQSSESDFLFVTTQTITQELMAALSADVGDERTLLVCCSAWRGKPDHFPNLTLKKIPPVVLSKCEWGQDDYSSFVANLKRIDPDSIPGTLFDQDYLSAEESL